MIKEVHNEIFSITLLYSPILLFINLYKKILMHYSFIFHLKFTVQGKVIEMNSSTHENNKSHIQDTNMHKSPKPQFTTIHTVATNSFAL